MKSNSKVIMYLLVVLIVGCLAAGGLGYYKSSTTNANDPGSKNNDNNGGKTKEYKVNYKYYLDGIEVEEEIKDEKENIDSENFEGAVEGKRLYSFEKYSCTNEVKGTWSDDEWKFTPVLTADATCRLYFIKNTHEVKVTGVNATLKDNADNETVKVEKDVETKVSLKPKAGYKYANHDCSNRTEASYDAEKNILTIKSAPKDSECTVSFAVSAFTAQVKVQNGTIDSKEENKKANYGEALTFAVVPAENYDKPTIDCTNGQIAVYKNGDLKINSLTNDTVCTVSFTISKNKVTLNVENGTIINADNSATPNVKETTNNGVVTFGISKNDGYLLTNPELSCNDENVKIIYASGTITISGVTKDTTCSAKLKKDETVTNPDNGEEENNNPDSGNGEGGN